MGNAAQGPRQPGKQRESTEEDDEPFGLHGNRRKEKHYPLVGKEHAKGEQNAEYPTRCAHCGIDIAIRRRCRGNQELHHGGAHHAKKEIEEKAPGSPEILDLNAKHPQGQHVDEEVDGAAMKEGGTDQLPNAETRV